MTEEYDFVVIGGGSAGYAAATTATKLGLKTAVIEGGEKVGGLCILRGCMPSKTLIESGNRFRTLQRAREFGLRAENISAVPAEIFARKNRLIEGFADYRRKQLKMGGFHFIRGWASFIDAHTIAVATGDERRTIRGKTFLIATGSRSTQLPIPGLAETGYRDSDQVLETADLPSSVIVLGGGATALEFAHYYASLGATVTVLQRSSQVLKDTDPDIACTVTEALRKRGLTILCDTHLERVERTDSGKCVHFRHGGETRTVEAAEIVYALGREPNFDGLELDRAGLKRDGHFLVVNNQQQTSAPHIFAAGDAAGPHEIVHLAIQQGELAARNAASVLRGDTAALGAMDYRLKLFVIFTEPEVAAVGWTEKELMAAGASYRVSTYPFDDHGKSMVMGETEGLVKLIAAAPSGEILGAAVVGPHAADLIHEITVAMHFHGTASDLARVPHYHPTLSEIWLYPAEELA